MSKNNHASAFSFFPKHLGAALSWHLQLLSNQEPRSWESTHTVLVDCSLFVALLIHQSLFECTCSTARQTGINMHFGRLAHNWTMETHCHFNPCLFSIFDNFCSDFLGMRVYGREHFAYVTQTYKHIGTFTTKYTFCWFTLESKQKE